MDPARRRFETVLAEVYEPLQRYLLRRADRPTAEEALGDTLVVLWRRVDDIPADATLPWCYAVARRCLANQVRGDARRLRLVDRLGGQPQPVAPDPADDREPDLAAALQRLRPDDQELLRLWAWEQLAPREIATVLGVTANAVSIHLHRALGRLRADLTDSPSPAPAERRRKSPTATGHLPRRTPGGEEASI